MKNPRIRHGQSIQLVGTEYLTALVNERKVRIRTLKGKTPNGWHFWMLDNPDFPMLVKGDASWHWTVPSFTYPDVSTKSLLKQLETKGVATTHAILFAFNSADLSNESRPTLNAVADYLKANPSMKIQVEGYTDSIGGGPFNLQLLRSRAESVKKYLTQQAGINSDRVTSAGFGMSDPVAGNATPEGRALNRRVVFRETRARAGGN